MSSHLYALADSFAVKSPPPGALRAAGVTWINACGALCYQFTVYAGGWAKVPAVVGPTAAAVAAKSGWLNPDYASAPIGAYHFFALSSTPDGHVARDLNGGGTDLIMATGRAVKVRLASYLGIQSVPGYVATGGVKYLGWAINYGGGVSAYTEPVAAPTLAPNERQTVSIGANVRVAPDPTSAKTTPLKGNFVYTVLSYTHGVAPSGSSNDVWFEVPGGWAWSGGFNNGTDLTGLTQFVATPALWAVTFDANGGSPTPGTIAVTDGDVITAPTPPTRDGYTFAGWDNGLDLFVMLSPVHSDLTLVAQWDAIVVAPTPPVVTEPPTDSGSEPAPDSGADSGSGSGPVTPPVEPPTAPPTTTPTTPVTPPTTPTKPSTAPTATTWGTIAGVVIAVGLAIAAFLFGH